MKNNPPPRLQGTWEIPIIGWSCLRVPLDMRVRKITKRADKLVLHGDYYEICNSKSVTRTYICQGHNAPSPKKYQYLGIHTIDGLGTIIVFEDSQNGQFDSIHYKLEKQNMAQIRESERVWNRK